MANRDLIEFVFRHEADIAKAVWERKNDPGGRSGGNGSGHCNVSDPTPAMAIRHAEELPSVVVEHSDKGYRDTFTLRRPEKWLRVVRHIKSYYAGDTRQLEKLVLEMHYLHDYQVKDICKAGGFSPAYYNIIRHEILTATEVYAIGLGLIANKY